MPRRDVEFQTTDHVTLRGWFFTPEKADKKLPCLVMAHGWSAVKEMDLDAFAEHFISHLRITCLVYDNRAFGASDAAANEPRYEIVPSLQQADYSDAITYAQSLDEVNPERIGIWGSSYSGGHVLFVGAVDHRQARAQGKAAGVITVVDADPMKPSALPTPDSYTFFAEWEKKSGWKNECTIRSVELLRANDPSHMISRISPTPLLMTVAENDVLTPTDISIEAFSRAREPKSLHIIPGGHFDGYTGANLSAMLGGR
ncbi:hypothetical protein LTR81_025150 [Elasticomyces elasticus]